MVEFKYYSGDKGGSWYRFIHCMQIYNVYRSFIEDCVCIHTYDYIRIVRLDKGLVAGQVELVNFFGTEVAQEILTRFLYDV